MKKTIHKYTLTCGKGPQYHRMPRGSTILKVDIQHAHITFWAFVDTEAPEVTETFYVFATGEAIGPDVQATDHVGTVSMYDGNRIWHIFKNPEPF